MSNSAVSYTIVSDQTWLTASPNSGTLAPNSTVNLTLLADPEQLSPGQHSANLGAGPAGVPITAMTVNFNVTGFNLVPQPTGLTFAMPPDDLATQAVKISSSDLGSHSLSWQLKAGPWASIPTSGPLTTPGTVTVQVSTSGLADGTVLTGEVDFSSPDRVGYTLVVPISVTVDSTTTSLVTYPPQLNFYSFASQVIPQQPLTVFSSTGRTLQFSAQLDPNGAVALNSKAGSTPSTLLATIDQQKAALPPRTDVIGLTSSDGNSPRSVQVLTLLRPNQANAFAQIADGGGYKTTLSISNADTVPATVTVRFHQEEPAAHSTALWSLALEGNPSLTNVTIPVGGVLNLITAGTPSTTSQGWAEFVSQQRLTGTAIFRQSKADGTFQEAAVPLSNTLQQRALLPFDNTSGAHTGLAIANMSTTETAQLRFAVRDGNGKVTTLGRFADLPPGGHLAVDLAATYPYMNGQSGTLDIAATTGYVSMLGLRYNATGAFTSFEAQSFNVRPTGRRSFAQVADGGGYSTTFTLVNNDAVPAQVSMKFWRETTGGISTPWTPALTTAGSSPQTVDPNSIVIPAGAAITLQTPGTDGTTSVGSAEVTAAQWVTGFAVFRQRVSGRPDQEAAVPLNVGTPIQQALPFDNTGIYTTSIALANISDSDSGEVNLVFRTADGRSLGLGSVVLPPRGHRAFSLKAEYPFLVGQKGMLLISTLSGQTTAVGLRFVDSGAYTSLKIQAVQ